MVHLWRSVAATAVVAWMAQACTVPTETGYDTTAAAGIATIASFAPDLVTCDVGYTGTVTYTACVDDANAYTLGGCTAMTDAEKDAATQAADAAAEAATQASVAENAAQIAADVAASAAECTAPTDTTGYTIGTIVGGDLTYGSFVTPTSGLGCATDYTGAASATTCAAAGQEYTLTGCTAMTDADREAATQAAEAETAAQIAADVAATAAAAAAATACQDITDDTVNAECFGNLTWASQTGIGDDASYYAAYPTLSSTSSALDFQCALYDMGTSTTGAAGTGWSCPKPCTSTLTQCAATPAPSPAVTAAATPAVTAALTTVEVIKSVLTAAAEVGATTIEVADQALFNEGDVIMVGSQKNTIVAFGSIVLQDALVTALGVGSEVYVVTEAPDTVSPPPGTEGSFPWWAAILIGLAIIGIVCGVIMYLRKDKATPKQGKRALRQKVGQEPERQPVTPANQPTYTTQPTYASQPAVYPQYAPQYAPQGIPTNSYPLATAQPLNALPTTASMQPFQSMQPQSFQQAGGMNPQAAAALFDQLDVNHSGAISRQQFQQLQMR